jgi:hypothetical protein
VARLPAVMARPCSTDDQMATSTVSQRKSGELSLVIKGNRARTAALALFRVSWEVEQDEQGSLHATHGEKWDQGDLGPALQLQVPNKESG